MEVYQRLDKGVGLKRYIYQGPIGIQLKVKFRIGDLDVKERRARSRKAEEDNDDMFKCEFDIVCDDRIHIVGGTPLHTNKIKFYMSEIGQIEGCDREAIEPWECENKPTTALRGSNWPQQARVEALRGG